MKMRRNCIDKNETFAWETVSLSQAHLLTCIYKLVGGDEKLLRFIFDLRKPKLRLASEDLLLEARAFSHGEQLLIQAGIDLWCGQGNLKLIEALETWDEANLTKFVQAICHFSEIRNPVMHALIDDENSDGIPL